MGKKFSKFLKLFYVFVITFLAIVYVTSVVYNIIYLDVFLLVFIHIALVFIALIMSFIFSYYRNMAVDIKFYDDDIIIRTNKDKFTFPKRQVVEIVKLPGKVVLNCYVDGKQKHFLYQTIYVPFKENKAIIEYLKDNLPNCKFSTRFDLMLSLYYWR